MMSLLIFYLPDYRTTLEKFGLENIEKCFITSDVVQQGKGVAAQLRSWHVYKKDFWMESPWTDYEVFYSPLLGFQINFS